VLLRAEDIGVRFALRSGLFGARRTFKAVDGGCIEPTIGRQERDKRAVLALQEVLLDPDLRHRFPRVIDSH
jgi:hypothetical protein